jgi:hypothetical protein
MKPNGTLVAVLGAALLVAGCDVLPEDIWPTLTGDEPERPPPPRIVVVPSAQTQEAAAPAATSQAITASPLEPEGQPQRFAQAPAPPPSFAAPTQGFQQVSATGTFVGAKVNEHRAELEALKARIGQASQRFQQLRVVTEQNAQRYYAVVAAISARLQIGTTPGNPVLVSQWNTAQADLDRVLTDIAGLNTLANDIAAQAAVSAYLFRSIGAAYGLQGAVEEDHRQLARLEDEVNRTVVLIDRLLNWVNDVVDRQTSYVNNERRHLTTLSLAIKNGEMFGPPLSNRAYIPTAAAPTQSSLGFGRQAETRQPLVVIRFDRADVPYQQALYSAVSQALDRKPTTVFDVVAVAPVTGTPARVALNTSESKRHAERVYRSLVEMGLPGNRLSISTTTSTGVATNEVHVYVR